MTLWQLFFVGFLGLIVANTVRSVSPNFSVYASVAVSILLTLASLVYVKPAVSLAMEIINNSRLGDAGTLMLKICSIGVVSTLAADICADFGESAIGTRIILLGKCAIALSVVPVLNLLITSAEEFLS